MGKSGQEGPPTEEKQTGGGEYPRGHQKHENRENPLADHPTGHLGYSRPDDLTEPRIKGVGDEKKNRKKT